MAAGVDPRDNPQWHSIGREANLACQLIGSGATALGRANYADNKGEYYSAFFGLSVGLERLVKLIVVADFAISNKGQMPTTDELRKFGHKLCELIIKADTLAKKHRLNLTFRRPKTEISKQIVKCLDEFADAGKGRYANFEDLCGSKSGSNEPIRQWWSEVAELILKENYFGKRIEKRIVAEAKIVDASLSQNSTVLYFNENGDAIQDILSSSIRTGQTNIVQKYGRYHALTVVRWLVYVFSELSKIAYNKHNIRAFSGAGDYFQTYRVNDDFLKTRKVWPLTKV